MYKKLIQFCKDGKLSFKYVKTFNMDEYVSLASDHPESYHYYMYENFFKHIDIDPGTCMMYCTTFSVSFKVYMGKIKSKKFVVRLFLSHSSFLFCFSHTFKLFLSFLYTEKGSCY